MMTEDLQFSVEMLLNGEYIAYCEKAILYDEQPIAFKQSWNQRVRWTRGILSGAWSLRMEAL
jgi:cellulose synthase/poly-beta-1,6-N-acetylglucosamine synthase-like glycosyltransferase